MGKWSFFLRCLNNKRPAPRPRRSAATTPTPIPAFAPVERPLEDCGGGLVAELVGWLVGVVDALVVGAVLDWLAVGDALDVAADDALDDELVVLLDSRKK